MSLRIAFDLDGTLADLDSALDGIARELFTPMPGDPQSAEAQSPPARPRSASTPFPRRRDGGGLTPEEELLEPPEVRALTRPQQQQVWDAVRGTENFWETLTETEPGIVARIDAMAEEGRWEVIFITQRPAANGDTTQRQTQRWLTENGFDMPSVFVLGAGDSRGKLATALALDVVVDDRPENCLDVKTDSRARAFLVNRRTAPHVTENAKRLGIEVVHSVGECLDILAAEPRPRDRAGLLKRIKKAFDRSGRG